MSVFAVFRGPRIPLSFHFVFKVTFFRDAPPQAAAEYGAKSNFRLFSIANQAEILRNRLDVLKIVYNTCNLLRNTHLGRKNYSAKTANL